MRWLPRILCGWGLTTKAMTATLAVLLLSTAVLIFYLRSASRDSTVEQTVTGAENTIQQFKTLRGYYTTSVVEKIRKHSSVQVSADHKNREDAIPLPATVIHDLSEEM